MKLTKLLLTFLTALIVALCYQEVVRSASSWHPGTPTALRGNWKQKSAVSDGGTRHGYDNKVKIAKHSLEATYFGGMPDLFTHIKWRRINHNTYALHARRFSDGYNHKVHRLTIKRISHNRMYMHLDGHSYFSTRHKPFVRY